MKIKIYSIIAFFFLSLSLSAQVDRSKMPESGDAPKINLGTPKKFKLSNGLQVLVVENDKLPRVSVTLNIDNPPFAKGNKKGVESFVGGMLGTGSTTISKEKFDEEVDYLGANISFGSQSGFASSLSKYFPRVLELMADAALNPVFKQEEFDKQMKQTLDGIKSNENSVSAIAGRLSSLLTYGKDHPYGEFVSEETLKNVKLEDVKNLYNRTFKPNNAYLVVIGDVNFKEVKKQVKTLFKNWKKGEMNFPSLPSAPELDRTEINFINMSNAVQSEIALINTVDLKMSNPDYYAVLLANQILGGGGTGRLYMNLREDKGYTYGAYSGISSSRYVSRFRAAASVRNMVTDSAVVEAMKEINKIRYKKATEKELEIAKAGYVGRFVRALERPSTIANYALDIIINDLPEDYYENYLQNIKAVTLDDIQNAAIKYFRGDRMRIVITGKGIDVLKNLEKTDYPIVYFDKKGNPTEKPEMTLPIPGGMTAEDVVNNYFNAIGGADKIAEVKSVMMVSTGNVQGIEITSEDKMMAPNKMTKVITGMGRVFSKVVFDGEKGYQEAQGRKIDFQAKQLEEMKTMKFPFMDEAYKTGKLDRIEPLEGNNAYVIIYGDTEVFYDVKTGLKVKEVKTAELPNGNKVQTPTTFGDYKVVNGIKFPHAIGQKMGPMSLNFEVKEIKVNEGVSDEDFK